jgi:hypothetical protein
MPTETKDLEFIQAILTRLAGNSFQMKGWNVALASAVIGFAATKDSHPWMACLALVPSFAFWGLDAYYLGLEKLYRTVYSRAIALQTPNFDLNAGELSAKIWGEMLFRPSVAGLHIPMLIVIVFVTLTGVRRCLLLS